MIELVRAPNPGAFTLTGTNSWVVDGRVVVDPGPPIASHVDALLAAAPRLETILVTHRHGDHAPAALDLRRRSGAKLLAPEGVLAGEVDGILRGGDRVEAGSISLEVVATPGHTAEHVCFLSSERDLFTGDMILGEGTTVILPPDGHMGDYLASLELLLGRRPARIYPGHGPVRDDAMELIAGYIAHRRGREEQILAALGAAALTVDELRPRIYPALGPGLEGAALAQLAAHLIHLRETGAVVERPGGRWQRA